MEFHEQVFPYTGSESRFLDWQCIEVPTSPSILQPTHNHTLSPIPTNPDPCSSSLPISESEPLPNSHPEPNPDSSPILSSPHCQTRKSERPKQKPTYLQDYHCSTLTSFTAHPIPLIF